jgi:hypothetical protein
MRSIRQAKRRFRVVCTASRFAVAVPHAVAATVSVKFRWNIPVSVTLSNYIIADILNGDCSISAGIATLLGWAFGTTPQYWPNLQAVYDAGVGCEAPR